MVLSVLFLLLIPVISHSWLAWARLPVGSSGIGCTLECAFCSIGCPIPEPTWLRTTPHEICRSLSKFWPEAQPLYPGHDEYSAILSGQLLLSYIHVQNRYRDRRTLIPLPFRAREEFTENVYSASRCSQYSCTNAIIIWYPRISRQF